jgi:hypothetical protein
MAEDIICPECQARLHLPETVLGREVQCPRCNTRFTAALTPASDEEAPARGQPASTPVPARPGPAYPAEPARRRSRGEEEDWQPHVLRRPSADEAAQWRSVRAGVSVFLLGHFLYLAGLVVVLILWLSSVGGGGPRGGQRGLEIAIRVAGLLAMLAIMCNWVLVVIGCCLWVPAPAGYGARGLAIGCLVLAGLVALHVPAFIDLVALDFFPDAFHPGDRFGPVDRFGSGERRLAFFAARIISFGLLELARLMLFPFFLRAAGRGLRSPGLATHGLVLGLATPLVLALTFLFNMVVMLQEPANRSVRGGLGTLETILVALDLLVPVGVLLWGVIFLVGARISIGSRLREMGHA